MDPAKLRIFKSGMSDEQREILAKSETVEAEFKRQKALVNSVMRHVGFQLILDKCVIDLECAKIRLQTCKEKELARLQLEVKIRKEFLHKFTPFAS